MKSVFTAGEKIWLTMTLLYGVCLATYLSYFGYSEMVVIHSTWIYVVSTIIVMGVFILKMKIKNEI